MRLARPSQARQDFNVNTLFNINFSVPTFNLGIHAYMQASLGGQNYTPPHSRVAMPFLLRAVESRRPCKLRALSRVGSRLLRHISGRDIFERGLGGF